MSTGDPAGSAWMAATAGQYQTVVTRVLPDGTARQLVLKPNPRRWYAEIHSFQGLQTMGRVLPGDLPAAPITFGNIASPTIAKYRDAPSMVTGPWFGSGTDADGWLTVEVNYVGD